MKSLLIVGVVYYLIEGDLKAMLIERSSTTRQSRWMFLCHCFFSSQFIPYIYKLGARVATLQWAGILGSWYLLDRTVHHLTGDKDKNSILHTQPASKQENIG